MSLFQMALMKPRFVYLFALPLLGFAVDEKLEYFESKIRPVLADKCYECHSAQSGKTKGGLRLDHVELILKGGDSGLPTIIPEDWSKGYLMEVVTHKDKEMAMPPNGEKLSDQNIEILKQWVNSGAFWPGQMDNIGDNKIQLWSFKPIQRKEVPKQNFSDPKYNKKTNKIFGGPQNVRAMQKLNDAMYDAMSEKNQSALDAFEKLGQEENVLSQEETDKIMKNDKECTCNCEPCNNGKCTDCTCENCTCTNCNC